MKVMDLIEKLYDLDGGMEIALGDMQFNCCDKNISIETDFMVDDNNELYNKEDYEDDEWDEIKDDLKPVVLMI